MLIEDWAQRWWRFWSVRLAMVAGVAAAYITAYPDELRKLVDFVPEEYRPLASAGAGFVIFAVPTWARLRQQRGAAAIGSAPAADPGGIGGGTQAEPPVA